MNDTLQAVERFAPVGLTPPQLLRLPAALRRAGRALAKLALYPLRLVTNPQRGFNIAALTALRELTVQLHHLHMRCENYEGLVAGVDRSQKEAACVLQHLSEMISEHEVALEEQQGLILEQGERQALFERRLEDHMRHPHPAPTDVTGPLGELRAALEKVREVQRQALEQLREVQQRALEAVRAEQQGALEAVRVEQQRSLEKVQNDQQRALAWVRDEQQQAVERVRSEVMVERSRVSLFLEEVRRNSPEPLAPRLVKRIAEDGRTEDDDLYAAFEERFRGPREMIMEQQKVYLPLIRQAGAGTDEAPVLDLGCGRGEWLQLLRSEGFKARGVDLNRRFLDQCRGFDLDVVESDVMEYLAKLPDHSLGALTGFHIVEHLPFEALLRLFDEAVRVLKPGGLAAFETPNPENVTVGACTFYIDPTHARPLSPLTLQFLAERRGLVRTEIRRLNGHNFDQFRPADLAQPGPVGWGALFECVKHHFLVPPDYAVIGWKV
jgi:O-antigen chain-terminating methyltransferase